MSRREVLSYSSGTKFLHWTIAIIVILMLSGSFFLDDVPKQYQGLAYLIHKSLGLTVLFLMIVRFYWILITGKPKLPITVSFYERLFAYLIQYAFYLLLIAMPMCGWIMSVAANRTPSYFGLFNLPLPIEPNKLLAMKMKDAHNTIAWILIGLLVFHVAGALKHHFLDKDKVLKRMLPWG